MIQLINCRELLPLYLYDLRYHRLQAVRVKVCQKEMIQIGKEYVIIS